MTAQRIEVPMNHNQDTRIALLEQSLGHLTQKIASVDQKIDFLQDDINRKFSLMQADNDRKHIDTNTRMDKLIDRNERTFDRFEKELIRMNDRHYTSFIWIISAMAGMLTALGGLMAHGFHWF